MDHRSRGWFLPHVDDDAEAERAKAEFLADYAATATGRETLQWVHEGRSFVARVGEPLNFYGDVVRWSRSCNGRPRSCSC